MKSRGLNLCVALALCSCAFVAVGCGDDEGDGQGGAGGSGASTTGTTTGEGGGVTASTGPGVGGGGGGTPEAFDLAFNVTGYAPHEGQELQLAVVQTDTNTVVASESTQILEGTASLNFPGVLLMGVAYHLDYYADHNSSGQCDPPPADHVWRTLVPAVADDVVIDDAHDAVFEPAACESF